jgi:hypothetical protein
MRDDLTVLSDFIYDMGGHMMQSRRCRCSHVGIAAVVLVIGSILASASNALAQSGRGPRVNPTAATVSEFEKRLDAYAALHKKLEASLPKLPTDATPQQIDQNQRALGNLIAQARANAKPGDLFTPDMQRLVRRLCADVFKGSAGREAERQVHDEPHPITPEINKRYPDVVPLSTMPLRVLAELPKLPDELEYRFIHRHLILMDVHAHIMLDYVLNAIPVRTGAGGR